LTKQTSEESDFDELLARLLEQERIQKGETSKHLEKRPKRRVLRLALVSLSIFLVLFAAVWVYQDNSWHFSAPSGSGAPRAALLDQLSATVSDPAFNDSIRSTLLSAGYTLDYYSPAQVTISLLQTLPLKDYNLIIVRSHSGSDEIYTTEPYTTSKYAWEQLTNQIAPVELYNKTYFSITNNFVTDSMRGTFPGSLIIIMGCSGLYSSNMATALLSKGATAVVGWSGAVDAGHSDQATATLLQYLAQGKTIKDAVSLTSAKLGPDPIYGGHLAYYDFKVGLVQQIEAELTGIGLVMVLLVPVGLSPFLVILIPKIFSRR
jgi:hypothetical protein